MVGNDGSKALFVRALAEIRGMIDVQPLIFLLILCVFVHSFIKKTKRKLEERTCVLKSVIEILGA